jgi:hypothetical protein
VVVVVVPEVQVMRARTLQEAEAATAVNTQFLEQRSATQLVAEEVFRMQRQRADPVAMGAQIQPQREALALPKPRHCQQLQTLDPAVVEVALTAQTIPPSMTQAQVVREL